MDLTKLMSLYDESDCVVFLGESASPESLAQLTQAHRIKHAYLVRDQEKLSPPTKDAPRCAENIEIVSYEKLVELCTQHNPIYSWY